MPPSDRLLHWFAKVAITNHHKQGGLKQKFLAHSLEARSPKSSCWQGWFFLEVLRSICSLLLLASVVASNPWHSSAYRCIASIFTWRSVSVSKFPSSYKDTSRWIRADSNRAGPCLNLLFLQRRSHSKAPGVRT